MRLSEMNREQLEKHLDSGDFSHQDVIDMYDDLQQSAFKIGATNMSGIVIKLDGSQRFLMEDPDSVAVIMVDQMTIHPIANQVVYSGYYFDIDYLEMDFSNKRKVQMVFNAKLDAVFGEEE